MNSLFSVLSVCYLFHIFLCHCRVALDVRGLQSEIHFIYLYYAPF